MADVTMFPVEEDEVINKLYVACRTCYSAGTPQDMYYDELYTTDKHTREQKLKLLDYVISSGHHSVLEHVQLTFMISGISRSLSHQLVRHRLASMCLSKDTVVRIGRGTRRTLEELYNLADQYKNLLKIRCFNESTREIITDKVGDIIHSGVKPVYEVTTKLGYSIKATKEHRFWTPTGWKQLGELTTGDIVFTNGIPAYKDKEWLRRQYKELNKTLEEVAEMCNVSTHTIRKWAKIFGVQKEIGKGMTGRIPPNKGRNKHNYEPMLRTSVKMMGNNNAPRLFGDKNRMWKGDDVGIGGGYNRSRKSFKKQGTCEVCGATGITEIHHIDKNPKNYNRDNLIELCVTCHHKMHTHECCVIREDIITGIKFVGNEDTYDICMAGDHHNFIANGFAVHNSQQSQRYVEFKDGNFEYLAPTTIEKREEALSEFIKCMEYISKTYAKLTELGIPAEDARAVLPNACCTNMTWSCNLRELIHVLNERLCTCAQQEIRNVAREVASEVIKALPFMKPYLGPKCEFLGYCNEPRRSCGRKKLKSEVIK